MSDKKIVIRNGCGSLGSMIAVVVSWSINKSIGWAVVHGIFGWLYVLYYALGYGIAQ